MATVTEEGVAPVVATGTVEAVAKSKRRIEARWRAAGAFAANLEGLVEGGSACAGCRSVLMTWRSARLSPVSAFSSRKRRAYSRGSRALQAKLEPSRSLGVLILLTECEARRKAV